jgi:hypothetical protein
VSLEFEFFADQGLFVARFDRESTPEELARDFERLVQHPSFANSMDAIWDLSNLDLTRVPLGDIRRLPGILGHFMQRRGKGYRAALVASRPVDFYLCRLYLQILRLIGDMHLRVFRSLPEARAWLALRGS